MNIRRRPDGRLALALLIATASPALAQSVGSMAWERARVAEITGDSAIAPSRRPLVLSGGRVPSRLLAPELRLTWNSAIPYSLNDGAMWAGRGVSGSLTAGVMLTIPSTPVPLRVVIAPTIGFSQNRPFQIFPDTLGRSTFANQFYSGNNSLDLPMRFGELPLYYVEPGRSRLEVATDRIAFGLTTDEEWWGPAIRNTLVLGNNARGIPRLYLANRRPFATRAGTLDATWITGTLTESNFFDRDPDNDYRSLSGVRLQLRPAFDSGLVLGLARVVYTESGSAFLGPLVHAFDAFIHWEYMRLQDQDADQIMSLFARWVVPGSGFELYGEFARMDNPRSATELLIASHHSGAYTVGFQWAQRRAAHDYFRLQGEATYLEQNLVFPDRPPSDFYAGRSAPQGYTQRGQTIGAAIGPGGSSQWFAVDYLARGWQAGWFLGRVRWNRDALHRNAGANFLQHDATLLSGVRGGIRTRLTDMSWEATYGMRYNYLFQWGGFNPAGIRTVDVRNLTLSLHVTP